MTRALILALCLAACAGRSRGVRAPKGDPVYRAVAAVSDAWTPDLRPLPTTCREAMRSAQAYRQTAEQFSRSGWCPRLADGTCGECGACKDHYLDTGRRRRPSLTVYLAPGGGVRAVVEAATRFAARCAGYGEEDWWWGRRSPELWGPQGVRARALGAL